MRAGAEAAREPDAMVLAGDGRFPNSRLPVLVWRGAMTADAGTMERGFAAQGWGGAWRNGIYRFEHFHSNAHEVLGIAGGAVRVRLGGPSGREVDLRGGDVVLLPAGTAHRNMGDDGALVVVGAYPGGSTFDLRRGDPAELEEMRRRAAAVAMPGRSPVPGGGELERWWG